MSAQTVAFGPFLLNPDNGTLFRDGELVAIGQKGALLLGALVDEPRSGANQGRAHGRGVAGHDRRGKQPLGPDRDRSASCSGPRPTAASGSRPSRASATASSASRKRRPQSRSCAPEPVIPSLAVLPFQNMSGDPEQDYFADGIVEDIITALSRFKSFAVIARNSSFVYKGRAVDVRQVARELGVRYVLEGSVRRAGERLRITAQLDRRHIGRASLGRQVRRRSSKTYSTCRTGSPKAWSQSSSRKSGEPRSSARAASDRKASTPTISICRRWRRFARARRRSNAEAYALLMRSHRARAELRRPASRSGLGA